MSSGASIFIPIAVKASVTVGSMYLLSELISWNRDQHEESGTVETFSDVTHESAWESAPGAAIPLAKVPYSKPATYVSSPIDPTNLPVSARTYGPYNDPRRNVVYSSNMARIQYSGAENKADTNLMWPRGGGGGAGASISKPPKSECGCSDRGSTLLRRKKETVKMGVGEEPGNTLFFK